MQKALTKTDKAELVATFERAWALLGRSSERAAKAYKACVDAGIRMDKYVTSKTLHDKLMYVATETIVPIPTTELLFLPKAHVEVLAALSKEEQKKVLSEGLEVRRPRGVVREKFMMMSAGEVKRAVDTTAGKGRILTIDEQDKRSIPQPHRHDQVFEIRLDFAEAKDLLAAAHKRGCSPQVLIRDALKRDGVLS